jgi:flavin-dependent dehydrogenase
VTSVESDESVEVAIVGGSVAGAVLATRLAQRGHQVVVLERSPAWVWRAGGVFSSPAAMAALRRAGFDGEMLAKVARPIPAMRLETRAGTGFRLTYGTESGGEPAVGFDRARLDTMLLECATTAGADVRRGRTVTAVDLANRVLTVRGPGVDPVRLRASVIVGADGPHSVVARAAGVDRPVRLRPRVGLSYHLADPDSTCTVPRDARMVLLDDGYIGIAPVPGGRVNVGIVLGPSWRARLMSEGAPALAARIVARVQATEDDAALWRTGQPIDRVAGAWPLGHRVTRRAGPGWLLVGDAAGFLDPFTGEGLHRAVVSTELAAPAIEARGRRSASGPVAFDAFDRAMQRRFLAKDAVSWLVQSFLGHPLAFEYAARRVATRDDVRATMGLVMGDLVPASRALDPRYLGRLLAP